jgi:hypothetical protein
MAFISIGKIDKNLIPMIAGCIFCFLNRILNQYDGSLLFKNQIMMNIYISTSKLFTIIPFILLKINSKKVSSNDIQTIKNQQALKYMNKSGAKRIIAGKWGFIFLAVMIYFVNQIFFVLTIKVHSNTTILNILITSFFYYLIFKIKLYRHHYLSIILIIIVGFIIDMILGNLLFDIDNNLGLFFFRLLREVLFSLSSVVDKYILEKKFGSVYEILLTNGVITSTLFIIFAIIDHNFFGIYNYEEYFNNFNTTELLVASGVIITQLGLNVSILFTNKNNSPCHIFIIFIFGQLAYYIDFSGSNAIVIFCLIIILFLSFVFNEILEINFLGLSDNTKKNISKRAETEDNMIITKSDTYDSMLEGQDGYILKSKDFKSNEYDTVDEKDE